MKKIKSIYILFIFAAITSYSLWACTGTGTSETTSDADSTQIEEVEEPDTRPASAAIDTNFYIKATIEGQEYIFNYLPIDGKNSYNLMKSNLFRIERCADDHCKRSFYLQAHNFDFNQTAPFTLTEGQDGSARKDIIMNLILTNNKGEFKNQWKDAEPFEMTIDKIENDIYEGTFKGKVQELNNKNQGSTSDITGFFRTKMIIKDPAA